MSAGPRPVRLVYHDAKGRFRMGREAVSFLQRLEGPIGMVSVCGLARQGKSYISNLLGFKERIVDSVTVAGQAWIAFCFIHRCSQSIVFIHSKFEFLALDSATTATVVGDPPAANTQRRKRSIEQRLQ